MQAYFRAYAREHRETLKAYHAEYYQKHSENWNEGHRDDPTRRRERYALNRDAINARRRLLAAGNRPHLHELARAARLRNRSKKLERDRLYRIQKPEIYKASIARARAAKPDEYRLIHRASVAARRSRKRSAPTERVSLQQLFARDSMRCHICLSVVQPAESSIDHLIPVVRNGAFAAWNLMLAHVRCNQRRGTAPVLEQEDRGGAEAYISTRLAKYVELGCAA